MLTRIAVSAHSSKVWEKWHVPAVLSRASRTVKMVNGGPNDIADTQKPRPWGSGLCIPTLAEKTSFARFRYPKSPVQSIDNHQGFAAGPKTFGKKK